MNEDGDVPEKAAFCAEHGLLQYVVLKREPKEGLQRRRARTCAGFEGGALSGGWPGVAAHPRSRAFSTRRNLSRIMVSTGSQAGGLSSQTRCCRKP